MSKQKNSGRKAKIPALFRALTRRVTISADAARSMALKPYLVLDALKAGRGSMADFDTLTQYSVFLEILCERGFLTEELPRVHCAQAGLLRCGNQQRLTGKWALDEEAREDLSACADLYWRQLQLISAPELVSAQNELKRVLAKHVGVCQPQPLAA